MIAEGPVLLRVQHLQESGRGIAPEVHPDLVNLIHHKDGVVAPRLFQPLDDPPGQGPHVGPPVPPDLRLILDAS